MTTAITASTTVFTLNDLAKQYFGVDFEYIDRYTNFIRGIGLNTAPWILIKRTLEIEIDMKKVIEWLVFYCEDLCAQTNVRYGSDCVYLGGLVEPETADAIGAVMILGSLHPYIKITSGRFGFYTKVDFTKITRKDAVYIAKLVLENKLKELYAEHPHLEFDKLLGLTLEQRHDKLLG
ncbi:hypothetical protein R2E40_10040 [Aeromonas sp. CD]|uniref:hypothetical protein n=1 Tax=Aeromonas sp. CD TaxID=3080830 RepID=UPI002966D23E|nr:hypothetical protein [Aeromonas sp. CD]WOX54428.1 hypothetical protein R2E40_10040 [Aeromonas sp. CD]